MGLYDVVLIEGLRCADGHVLEQDGTMECQFQSHDFGRTFGYVTCGKVGDGIAFESGGYGNPIPTPIDGVFEIGCECTKCPCLLQEGTYNIITVSVMFNLHCAMGRLIAVEPLSETAQRQLARIASTYPGCSGEQMSYAVALEIRDKYYKTMWRK